MNAKLTENNIWQSTWSQIASFFSDRLSLEQSENISKSLQGLELAEYAISEFYSREATASLIDTRTNSSKSLLLYIHSEDKPLGVFLDHSKILYAVYKDEKIKAEEVQKFGCSYYLFLGLDINTPYRLKIENCEK
jgi:NAD dependent epimerase/dehydratase family enzyme